MKKAICILLFLSASARAGEPIKCLGHTGFVETVAFSPDGKMIASGGRDRMVRIWDANTGKQLQELPIYEADMQEPDVRSIAYSPDSVLVVAAANTSMSFWSAGKKRDELPTKQTAWFATYSHDGARLAIAGPSGISVWDVNKRQILFQNRNIANMQLALSPDGSLLASPSGIVFRSDTGQTAMAERSMSCHWVQFRTNTELVTGGALPRNDSLYAGFTLWDLDTKQKINQCIDEKARVFRSGAISPNGRIIATGEDDVIRLWDLKTSELKVSLKGQQNEIVSLSFSPDGKKLASASFDKSVFIWPLQKGEEP